MSSYHHSSIMMVFFPFIPSHIAISDSEEERESSQSPRQHSVINSPINLPIFTRLVGRTFRHSMGAKVNRGTVSTNHCSCSIFCISKLAFWLVVVWSANKMSSCIGSCLVWNRMIEWLVISGRGISDAVSTNIKLIGIFIYPFPHNDTFWRPWETYLLKTQWEKEKLLVTSNFSFSDSVFYLFG